MARCIIIAPLYGGEESEWLTRREGDLLLCADGGYGAAVCHGMTPDLTIGDFDSMSVADVQGERIVLPVHKDDTDLAVCIAEGRKRGYRKFIAAGCLGGRFDHTLAAIQCAADCAMRGEKLWLCDASNRLTVLSPGTYGFPAMKERKLGLFAYSERITGVCLKGTVWELDQAELTNRYPLGCSNEWQSDEAVLSFATGLAAVCLAADAQK